MLSIAAGTRIFFAAGPTDMRKGFNGRERPVNRTWVFGFDARRGGCGRSSRCGLGGS